MTTLRLENLSKRYGDRRVVKDVNLALDRGEVVGLLGPNGAGKTTTFYMTVGMIPADGGRVLLDDEAITEAPMHLRARRGLGYLPQETSVFRKLTVEQNVLAILELLGVKRPERQARTAGLLAELGIQRLARSRAGDLSGGERRRLEISRALATDPSFMLLDEPFAGIDPLAVIDIKGIIRHLKSKGIGVLISDHNVRETLEVCDRAYILSDGTVIEAGTPQQIAASETARRIYLGDSFRL
ncbi:MAG: LPS export ABC transporter ATP-binding protein [Deltaproteobacteria bacterium]|nr:LPS export ABC transporter ATP-binding protein [Deltaproteobacteria bacterium]RLB95820.1 MAG: LPS export ABC transporter ATP-binding protein [Deltaproteobacteria bacterium]